MHVKTPSLSAHSDTAHPPPNATRCQIEWNLEMSIRHALGGLFPLKVLLQALPLQQTLVNVSSTGIFLVSYDPIHTSPPHALMN
ncbi:unnamed protein product [Periconia digitata]|uniref:Uncharacterized protein n=1 Tax=Periconia digitata TaxID=1303443 RepID=A0A9W4XF49_9PLEO|nr:unnamed protein product [Periconia digitata]